MCQGRRALTSALRPTRRTPSTFQAAALNATADLNAGAGGDFAYLCKRHIAAIADAAMDHGPCPRCFGVTAEKREKTLAIAGASAKKEGQHQWIQNMPTDNTRSRPGTAPPLVPSLATPKRCPIIVQSACTSSLWCRVRHGAAAATGAIAELVAFSTPSAADPDEPW